MFCSLVIWLSHEIRDMIRYSGWTAPARRDDENADDARREPRT